MTVFSLSFQKITSKHYIRISLTSVVCSECLALDNRHLFSMRPSDFVRCDMVLSTMCLRTLEILYCIAITSLLYILLVAKSDTSEYPKKSLGLALSFSICPSLYLLHPSELLPRLLQVPCACPLRSRARCLWQRCQVRGSARPPSQFHLKLEWWLEF